jgi:2-haloalkanoic acid dehalogenase type II
MPLPTQVKAVTFDCFGTLIDWNTGIGRFLADWAARNGLALETDRLLRQFGEAQRRHQVQRPFKSYDAVLRDAFLDVAAEHGIANAGAEAERFSHSVADWPAFPDTLAGLKQLKRCAVVGVMSNVDDINFVRVHAERLGGLLDEIVTADDVRAYKPDHAHFHCMRERLAARGIGQEAWLHIAQSRFHDIAPCRELGIACIWLDRIGTNSARGMTVFGADAEPDLTVYGMADAVAAV